MEKVLEKSLLDFIPENIIKIYLKDLGLKISEISLEEVSDIFFKYNKDFTEDNWLDFKNSTLLKHYFEQKNFFGENSVKPAFDINSMTRDPRYDEFPENLQIRLVCRFLEEKTGEIRNRNDIRREESELKLLLESERKGYCVIVENKNLKKKQHLLDIFKSKRPLKELRKLKDKKVWENFDQRVSQQMMETVWYFRYMGLSDQNVEKLTELILKIEPETRKDGKIRERKFQKSKANPEQKELVFNHFLDVARISGGRVEQGNTYWDFLNKEQQKNIAYFHNEKNLVGTFIIALLHDYVEDDFLSCDKIQEILKDLGFDESIIKRVGKVLPHLNVNNYRTDNGEEINHENYLDMLFEFPEAILVKISDKLSNYRSGIPKKNFKKGKKDELSLKVQLYEKFETKVLKIWGSITTPKRFLRDLEKNNPKIYTESKSFKKLKKLALSFEIKVSTTISTA